MKVDRSMYTPSMTAVRRWAGVSRNWVTQFLDNAESDETIVALIAMGPQFVTVGTVALISIW